MSQNIRDSHEEIHTGFYVEEGQDRTIDQLVHPKGKVNSKIILGVLVYYGHEGN
jgi:hypothetical protein